ncbi:MAG: YDG/SRA domain-containing protein [Bacteroidota bacterium]
MSRAPHFGHVPGYPPGSLFEDRRELADSKVHRPPQAGICGRAQEGAESIVLNGGYVDDEDLGDVIIYTGAGGNDRQTKRQVADQTLSRTNLALVTSLRLGLPVRVIRGSHRDVHDGPEAGYRYDGLHRVADYWADTGKDGFRIWRFRLEAIRNPEVEETRRVAEAPNLFDASPPDRSTSIVTRVIRDTRVTREVKRLYDFRCQICGERIETPTGPYAEAAHIRPLGRPHDGPDSLDNVLCLCPTDHAAFDLYAFSVADDGALVGRRGTLRLHPDHRVDPEHLRYHNAQYEAAHGAKSP